MSTWGFFDVAAEAVQFDEKTYAVPLAVKSLVLYTNDALISAPPKETEDLFRLAKDLPEDVVPLAYAATDAYFHMPWLFGFGGGFFDDDGNSTFDVEANAKSLDFMKRMDDADLLPKQPDAALATHLFNSNQAAMTISGPWFLSSIADGVEYSIHPLPIVTDTQLPAKPLLTVEAAFVSAFSPNLDAAEDLAAHLASLEVATSVP